MAVVGIVSSLEPRHAAIVIAKRDFDDPDARQRNISMLTQLQEALQQAFRLFCLARLRIIVEVRATGICADTKTPVMTGPFPSISSSFCPTGWRSPR